MQTLELVTRAGGADEYKECENVMSWLLWLVIAVGVVYVGCGIYMMIMESRLLYHPTRQLTTTPAHHRLHFEDVALIAADAVRLHGWFVPAPNAPHVVLLCHGNSGNIGDIVDTLPVLREAGMSVLAFDYRGYGHSEGLPTEQGTYEDALAAWKHLTEQRGYKPDQIVIYGRSLGAAVATWLATQVSPRALVFESGFKALPELAQELYPWLPVRYLASIHYNNEQRMRDVTCPTLFIHSSDDELIPIDHARRVYAVHRGPKQFVEIRGTHGHGYQTSGMAYSAPLHSFLRGLTA